MAVVLFMMAIITGVVYFAVRTYMLNEAQDRYLGLLLENHQEMLSPRRFPRLYL